MREPLLIRFSRTQLYGVFVTLMLLRVVVGFHFFKEGTSKLQDGNFSAEYFLAAAKGPFAPYFHALLEDHDGRDRLCIADQPNSDRVDFDSTLTFALWEDFVDRASSYYQFDSAELQDEIAERRRLLAEQIGEARATGDRSVNTRRLEEQREEDEQSILRLRSQIASAAEILDNHQQWLSDWLQTNRTEIFAHYGTEDRLDGFDRDGKNRKQAAIYVSALREQVETIQSDRQKKLKEWTGDVEGIWDSLESQINSLAVDRQAAKPPLRLHRKFDQQQSKLKTINQFIPWFDTTVGVLLILGLFTRIASLAGAGFLASVIATQPPWIPGTVPTDYQGVEMFALLVLFATCAGRFGGLDYFFAAKPQNDLDS